MRFHPSVTMSMLLLSASDTTFKTAHATLPMGGDKGGADFDPKGKSPGEVMRFCQALMTELYRHLGPDTDVPAGDIGVGAREVGYMAGMMKKLANSAGSVFTGKGLSFGGSLIRPEATGYGVVYFAQEMLARKSMGFEGMRVAISGSGNVAQYAAEKALMLGAQVVTVSDSGGTVHDPAGLDGEKLSALLELKNVRYGRIEELAQRFKLRYEAGRKPWHVPADIALPCATQNELDAEDVRTLVANGVRCVAEGANMPCNPAAVQALQAAGVLYGPGKASNAGGVATSGLEMSQNAMRLAWTRDEVDQRLHLIMRGIHDMCVRYGTRADGSVDYVDGANIAGFVKVADAMLAQGVT
jgi:glutamate dehydrogenase (NADP+)